MASLRGAANGYSWLVRSRSWLTTPAPDVWLSPRRRRLLSLWEAASIVLELDHKVLHPAILRSLRLRGDNRFLRPPDMLTPERWLQATVGDFSDGAPALVRSTPAALLDAQHLGATIVLRGSATPITHLTNQRARRALDSARLQKYTVAELAARWISTVDVPRSIPWLTCVATASRGTTQMSPYGWPSTRCHILTILPRGVPTVPPVFASCEEPLDLQAWLFGVGLHPEAMKVTSVAKATIYKYHLGLEVGNASQYIDLINLWERTLAVHQWRSLSRGAKRKDRDPEGNPAKVPKADNIPARPSQPPKSVTRDAVIQLKNSRQQQALSKARSAAASFDKCCYFEYCADFSPVQYIKALDEMLGKGAVFQLMKMSGQVNDVIAALRPYCRVVSLTHEVVASGGYSWTTGNREALSLLNEGLKLHQLPVKLVIVSKGESTPAYITYGFRCSKCHRQGHRRATCPLGINGGRHQDTRQGPVSKPPSSKSTLSNNSALPTSAAELPAPIKQPPVPAPNTSRFLSRPEPSTIAESTAATEKEVQGMTASSIQASTPVAQVMCTSWTPLEELEEQLVNLYI
ncbi:hypothetical protein LAZ67_10001834 [Cordylochernes scorpioides]|uniref:CCHC-type domain-containing protein n=1 Tax=Cordylochernes scorpioides TaxID=51811 RepID=A0ABY6KXV7_9ARAC|nr:hypothetical protein LAZ67_10001834 [Cordylochernes scorpioides]